MRTSRIFGSMRFRLRAGYLAITILAFFAISVIVSDIMEDFLVTQRTKEQSEKVARMALEIAPLISSNDARQIYRLLAERAQTMGGRLLVLDTDAVVQADSASKANGLRLPYSEVKDVLLRRAETAYRLHNITKTNGVQTNLKTADSQQSIQAVYYTAPITLEGKHIGVLLFSASIQDVNDSINTVVQRILLVFLVMTIVVVALSSVLSGWLIKPILELTAAIRNMSKQRYGVRVSVSGSSELAELGRAFNRMSEQIEDHEKLRDEFVSNASHELKTPLSTMKILAESMLYQDNPDPALMKEFFMDINSEVDRLTSIINDLLRLVHDDVSEAALNKAPMSLDDMVKRVVQRLMPLARAKQLALETRLEHVTLKADKSRLEQVVVNLVDNAIKYTDTGKIVVKVYKEADEAIISVSDTGIGIPNEARARVFERFFRVDKARSRGTGGTGLGLSIVESIVMQHGGYIQVDSEVGKGSTFIVRLPMENGD